MTTCNPVNLSYRFALPGRAETGFREAADPSVVRYEGEYWLFATRSGGYWCSHDLATWTFVPSEALQAEALAPDAAVIGGALLTTSSAREGPVPIFRSTDPGRDRWEKAADAPPHSDVCLFEDDDRRVYRYDGLSNKRPIYVCELDSKTLLPLGERVATYTEEREHHGWERRGQDHSMDDAPFIEGSWMTKHDGRYYLQYAAPGTEYNVYSDSALVSDSPMGPFRLQDHNPFSYKPTGFIAGAGHGSTFADEHGNFWHASTMQISAHENFERRVGIWPAGFDEDGVLFCNTSFGDWPTKIPTGRWDPWRDPFPGWMLLSYRASCSADSALADHPPEFAFDENGRTWWAASAPGPATLTADLGAECEVSALQINFAEHDVSLHGRGGKDVYHAYVVEGSIDGSRWSALVDRSAGREDRPHDYVELSEPARARHLRLHIDHVPGGTPAVSGFRAFGRAPGDPPQVPHRVEPRRDPADRRNLSVRWGGVSAAVGYQLWWGVAPDKLYSSCLVYAEPSYELRCLNSELRYYVAVEAFSRSGRSGLSSVTAVG